MRIDRGEYIIHATEDEVEILYSAMFIYHKQMTEMEMNQPLIELAWTLLNQLREANR